MTWSDKSTGKCQPLKRPRKSSNVLFCSFSLPLPFFLTARTGSFFYYPLKGVDYTGQMNHTLLFVRSYPFSTHSPPDYPIARTLIHITHAYISLDDRRITKWHIVSPSARAARLYKIAIFMLIAWTLSQYLVMATNDRILYIRILKNLSSFTLSKVFAHVCLSILKL